MPIASVLVRPPARPSNGALTLRRSLGAVARSARVEAVPRQYKMVINWGNSAPLTVRPGVRVLNKPEAIRSAVNKLTALRLLQAAGVRVPTFQTERPVVDGAVWFARTNLYGSGGDGIVAIRRGDQVPDAPLYVRYIPKLDEYRLHVVNNKVIFAQKKKRVNGAEQTKDQKLIRNHANGWVFCPVEVDSLTQEMRDAAVNSVTAVGLSFGAVDLLDGRDDRLSYTLEVNSACGLESPGLIAAYTKAFLSLLNGGI